MPVRGIARGEDEGIADEQCLTWKRATTVGLRGLIGGLRSVLYIWLTAAPVLGHMFLRTAVHTMAACAELRNALE